MLTYLCPEIRPSQVNTCIELYICAFPLELSSSCGLCPNNGTCCRNNAQFVWKESRRLSHLIYSASPVPATLTNTNPQVSHIITNTQSSYLHCCADNSASATMELSPIWRHLPGDVAELIFSDMVNSHFDTDPAYTWVCLRHLSAHLKRIIERRFGEHWLPKLSITLYGNNRDRIEYRFDTALASNPDADGRVTFFAEHHVHVPRVNVIQVSAPGRVTGLYLHKIWGRYNPTQNRNITVRLGEGYLSGGCMGGYIVNDTDLPGLKVLNRGKIRFLWKEAMNELLREEVYMTKVGNEMVCPPTHSLVPTAEVPESVLTAALNSSSSAPTSGSPARSMLLPSLATTSGLRLCASRSSFGFATSNARAAWPRSSTASPSPSDQPGRSSWSFQPPLRNCTSRFPLPLPLTPKPSETGIVAVTTIAGSLLISLR